MIHLVILIQIDITLLHWNGTSWECEKNSLLFSRYSNFIHPIQSIFAFNQNDIWFCGNGVVHFNGIEFNLVLHANQIFGWNYAI